MKSKQKSRIGCGLAIAFLVLVAAASSWYYMKKGPVQAAGEGIGWARAVEKCKSRYDSFRPSGMVNAPNCRKRTEDKEFFYFSWKKPLAIYVRNSSGKIINTPGECQVSKTSGEIVYMTLGREVLVQKVKKRE